MNRFSGNFARRLSRSVAALVVIAVAGPSQAANVRVLYAFQGGGDGAGPMHGVIGDKEGNLYGTTSEGGGSGCGGSGCGTLFKLAPGGTETVLYAFQGGSDGSSPSALVRDEHGNLYGMTQTGGDLTCYSQGCGTVFKLEPDGTKTVLHTFEGGSDGRNPDAGLLRYKGNLYGMTVAGGTYDVGTIFKLTPQGSESILYSFATNGEYDVGSPLDSLIADKQGYLYGTGSGGGTNQSAGGVFKLAPDGTETVLYNFCSQPACADGRIPYSALTLDKAGNLYGTTIVGGVDYGTVFRLAPDGTETVIHDFDPGVDGSLPQQRLLVDKGGNLWGTIFSDAQTCPQGLVYELSPGGSETLICLPAQSTGALVRRNGMILGTASGGAQYGNGVVFALTK
ncbi:MAG: choice-of-anchor tandem repeat GloVer-containing protein [Rhizomicrobium sp.]